MARAPVGAVAAAAGADEDGVVVDPGARPSLPVPPHPAAIAPPARTASAERWTRAANATAEVYQAVRALRAGRRRPGAVASGDGLRHRPGPRISMSCRAAVAASVAGERSSRAATSATNASKPPGRLRTTSTSP